MRWREAALRMVSRAARGEPFPAAASAGSGSDAGQRAAGAVCGSECGDAARGRGRHEPAGALRAQPRARSGGDHPRIAVLAAGADAARRARLRCLCASGSRTQHCCATVSNAPECTAIFISAGRWPKRLPDAPSACSARCWTSAYRRVDVLEFLLSSPVRWPTALENGPAALPVAEWNYLACAAGIVAGKANWADGLKRLKHQLEADRARRALDDDEGQLAAAARIAAAESLARYTEYLFARIAEVKQTTSWRGRVAALWALFSELVVCDPACDDLAEELEGTEDFDALELPLEDRAFPAFGTDGAGAAREARGALSRARARRGDAARSGGGAVRRSLYAGRSGKGVAQTGPPGSAAAGR